jgi:IS605 OrfB family transposase
MPESVDVIRTVKCRLESSNRKDEKLQRGVSDFQHAAKVTADMLPSFSPHTWERNNTQIYRTVKSELDDYEIKDKVVQNAVHRVTANFKSTRELDHAPPKGGLESDNFLILSSQGYDIAENDQGYGFKAKFIPYKPEWWHLNIGPHQRDYLERVFDGDASLGQAELVSSDDGPLARVAVKWGCEVTDPETAECVVGVDVGLRSLYALAVRDKDTGDVEQVEVASGNQFRHKRREYKAKIEQAQENDNHEQAKEHWRAFSRFTQDRLHKAATNIVSIASEHTPCVIRVEDLDQFDRENGTEIHQWPYGSLLDKIENKATTNGIAFERMRPYFTSQTCQECGYQNEQNRERAQFTCGECGYTVNADVNAALNIASA